MKTIDIIHLYWKLRIQRDNLEFQLDQMLMLHNATNFDVEVCLSVARSIGILSQRIRTADSKFPWLKDTNNPFDTYR